MQDNAGAELPEYAIAMAVLVIVGMLAYHAVRSLI